MKLRTLRDPRAVVFGLAVFGLSWVCLRGPQSDSYKLLFMAAVLLAASGLILVRRVWSNFLAAALGGYLPLATAFEFWVLPRRAEVPAFSLRHFAYFARALAEADGPLILFLILSALTLACSAHALGRLASR